jgi:hypothetical protein
MSTLPPLPEPDTHCFDDDTGKDVWSHSAAQMTAYAEQDRAELLSELAQLRSYADALNQRCVEDAADAVRYRWLTGGNLVSERWRTAYDKWDGFDGKAGFDAAIDAAMKGK